ncbi:MAG TPA: hypothetical protein VEI47_10440 [Gemmatimonadales bacterium]|nr:hypothetical protein [Gemmatimonadales bacterium]
MPSSPPNLVARRLLDDLLDGPAPGTVEPVLAWLLEASPLRQGLEIPRTRRLALLDQVLSSHPRQGELSEHLRRAWTHPSAVRLLAETGLPVHVTLVKEAVERVVDRLVPRLEPEDDLYVAVSHLGLKEDDAAWLEGLAPDIVARWSSIVAPTREAFLDAARLVAIRMAATGVAREVLQLTPHRPEASSPFFRLIAVVDALAVAPHSGLQWKEWESLRGACAEDLRQAHDLLETRGVSTDLIYRLELIESGLERIDQLLAVAAGGRGGHALTVELVRGSLRQRGVRSLGRTSLKRLARKVVEHTGETGERYLVRDRRDWAAIGVSAGWAGMLTAFTALGKIALGGLPLAPMVLGVSLAIDYSVSFILLQLFHLTLASKQPAMTAAALAAALEHKDDLEEQVELVAGVTRSQVIATIGNVLVTLPASLALVAAVWGIAGRPVLMESSALRTVRGLHPFLSLTAPYAALTGVFLWLSSLCAGWAANWSAYRGLPEAVARRPGLRRALGPMRAARLGQFIEHHLSGIVGYVVLGFLLGFSPVAFQFMGLPIEVRHVTLNAATLAIAAGSLYGTPAFHLSDLAWGLGGIVVMGACNFGVSFALALRTAMRARDLGRADRTRLWGAIRRAFRERPSRFLWRPRV